MKRPVGVRFSGFSHSVVSYRRLSPSHSSLHCYIEQAWSSTIAKEKKASSAFLRTCERQRERENLRESKKDARATLRVDDRTARKRASRWERARAVDWTSANAAQNWRELKREGQNSIGEERVKTTYDRKRERTAQSCSPSSSSSSASSYYSSSASSSYYSSSSSSSLSATLRRIIVAEKADAGNIQTTALFKRNWETRFLWTWPTISRRSKERERETKIKVPCTHLTNTLCNAYHRHLVVSRETLCLYSSSRTLLRLQGIALRL